MSSRKYRRFSFRNRRNRTETCEIGRCWNTPTKWRRIVDPSLPDFSLPIARTESAAKLLDRSASEIPEERSITIKIHPCLTIATPTTKHFVVAHEREPIPASPLQACEMSRRRKSKRNCETGKRDGPSVSIEGRNYLHD